MPDIRVSENTPLADGTVIPAGTLIRNVPAGMSRNQLLAKLNKNSSSLKVAGRQALAGLVDMLTGIPDVLANASVKAVNDVVRIPQAAGEHAAAFMSGNFDHFGTTPPLIDRPPLGQDFIMPNSNDVFAAAQVGGESLARLMSGSDMPVSTLSEAQNQQQAITDAGESQFPLAALGGDLAGGAASLATVRAPIAAQRAMTQLEHARSLEAARRLAARSSSGMANIPTLRASLNEAVKRSTFLKSLANRTGRAAEVGLEGATIGLLNGGDPLELAAYSAGGQVAGSILLGGVSAISGNGGLTSKGGRLMVAAGGIAALLQMVKSAAPGGEDSVIQSVESGFNKVLGGIALGTMAGIAGAGRVTNKFPVRALPEVADAITSLPRGATISVLNEVLKDPASEKVINRLRVDPNYFGSAATQRLRQAIQSERVSLTATIEELSNNSAFAEKLNAL